MQDLVLVRSYATEFEAELVKGKLEREGITAMIQAEDLSNVLPSLDYANGINVYVNPADLARVKEILNTTADDLTDDMDTSHSNDAIPGYGSSDGSAGGQQSGGPSLTTEERREIL